MVILMLNGQPAVEISDNRGRPQTYTIERLAAPSGQRLFRLLRQGDDAVYSYVLHYVHRRWTCDCKSFRFNPRRLATGCKHTRAIAELAAIFRPLASGAGAVVSQEADPVCL